MPQTLKDILGDDLYKQVKEKLGDTEVIVVDPNDPMVPKHRTDEERRGRPATYRNIPGTPRPEYAAYYP